MSSTERSERNERSERSEKTDKTEKKDSTVASSSKRHSRRRSSHHSRREEREPRETREPREQSDRKPEEKPKTRTHHSSESKSRRPVAHDEILSKEAFKEITDRFRNGGPLSSSCKLRCSTSLTIGDFLLNHYLHQKTKRQKTA